MARASHGGKPARLTGSELGNRNASRGTLFYFPADKMQGDIDNIVKPVLDALAPHLYLDDSQVDRILVQRFEPGKLFPFANPSPTLADAIGHPKPVLYIRVSDNPLGN